MYGVNICHNITHILTSKIQQVFCWMSVNRPSPRHALGIQLHGLARSRLWCFLSSLALPSMALSPWWFPSVASIITTSDDHIFRRLLRPPFSLNQSSCHPHYSRISSLCPSPHPWSPVSLWQNKQKKGSPVQTPVDPPSQVWRHFYHRLS